MMVNGTDESDFKTTEGNMVKIGTMTIKPQRTKADYPPPKPPTLTEYLKKLWNEPTSDFGIAGIYAKRALKKVGTSIINKFEKIQDYYVNVKIDKGVLYTNNAYDKAHMEKDDYDDDDKVSKDSIETILRDNMNIADFKNIDIVVKTADGTKIEVDVIRKGNTNDIILKIFYAYF